MRWALASDFQIPFQDDRAVKLWFAVLKWWKPDVLDYLGDVSDQFCFARFQEGRTTEFLNTLPKETQAGDFLQHVQAQENDTRKFYAKTRKMLPKTEMFSALGNHDIRAENYVDKKIPDLLPEITPENLWGLDSLGIDYIHYNDVPKHRFGDIYVHHGISALAEAGASVKSDVGTLGVSLIRGHSHRMGTYFKTYELKNETLRGYEIGHMCQVDSPGFKYTQLHNWQQGFMIAHIESGADTPDGYRVHPQLVEISPSYTCYVDGHKFSA